MEAQQVYKNDLAKAQNEASGLKTQNLAYAREVDGLKKSIE